jgi:3-hydroxybutyryl-CoA dehydrogenase
LLLEKLLDKDVAKERITEEQATEAKNRLQTTTKMDDLKDVDFVIEAVPVCVELKNLCFCLV